MSLKVVNIMKKKNIKRTSNSLNSWISIQRRRNWRAIHNRCETHIYVSQNLFQEHAELDHFMQICSRALDL